MTARFRHAAVVVALASTACAGHKAGAPSDARAVGAANEITRAQIGTKYTNAYEAIRALRRNWLMTRYPTPGSADANPLRVYVDGQQVGTIEALSGINATTIAYMHHYSGAEATTKFGMEAGGGVIYVSTSERRP